MHNLWRYPRCCKNIPPTGKTWNYVKYASHIRIPGILGVPTRLGAASPILKKKNRYPDLAAVLTSPNSSIPRITKLILLCVISKVNIQICRQRDICFSIDTCPSHYSWMPVLESSQGNKRFEWDFRYILTDAIRYWCMAQFTQSMSPMEGIALTWSFTSVLLHHHHHKESIAFFNLIPILAIPFPQRNRFSRDSSFCQQLFDHSLSIIQLMTCKQKPPKNGYR